MPDDLTERPHAAEHMLWQFARRILLWSGKRRTRYRRYFITFGLPLIGVWSMVLAYIFLTPKSYLSEIVLNMPNASVQATVSLQNIGQTSISSASPFASSSLSPIVIYKALAQSNSVRAVAARKLHMSLDDMPKPRVELIDQTAIMTIMNSGPSPESAQRRTHALYESLQDQLDELRRDESDRRLRAVRAGIADVEQRLNTTGHALQKFQEKGAIVSQEQFELLVRNLEAMRQKITEAESELQRIVAERTRLSEILGISPQEAAAALRFQSDPRYASLSRDYGEALLEHTGNGRKWGPRHPKVVASQQRLATIRSNLTELANAVIGDKAESLLEILLLNESSDRSQLFRSLVELDTKASGLSRSLAAMKSSLADFSKSIERRTVELAQLAELERQHKIAETVFSSAMARIDTSGQDVYSSYPLLQVVAPASLPIRPNSPKVIFALAGGLLATIFLILSMVIAWLRQPFIRKILKSV